MQMNYSVMSTFMPRIIQSLGLLAILSCPALRLHAADGLVAQTPPMGWNSWNTFKTGINEQLIHQSADALVSSGMQAAGYSYVTLDDGWQLVRRDSSGNLQYDSGKFPDGMKALGEYLHRRGLKFGIYTSAGVQTCMRREGSYDFEGRDVKLFASWGVDFVKVDWCCTHPKHLADPQRNCPAHEKQDYGTTGQQQLYKRWRQAISAADRPMVLSICEWGTGKPWLWAPEIGNMWRTTEDILPCRDCKKSWWGLGWQRILDQQIPLSGYAGPGHWNDPDMLVVGVKGLDDLDAKAHFSFWSMLAAPLIAGNDPRSMSPEIQRILTNTEVIAIDQDVLGKEGTRISASHKAEIWSRQLSGGAWAVILFNRSDKPQDLRFAKSELGIHNERQFAIRDLWAHRDLGILQEEFHGNIPAHAVMMLTITPQTNSRVD